MAHKPASVEPHLSRRWEKVLHHQQELLSDDHQRPILLHGQPVASLGFLKDANLPEGVVFRVMPDGSTAVDWTLLHKWIRLTAEERRLFDAKYMDDIPWSDLPRCLRWTMRQVRAVNARVERRLGWLRDAITGGSLPPENIAPYVRLKVDSSKTVELQRTFSGVQFYAFKDEDPER